MPDVTIVESSAEMLYGLIHQRFIITRQGLQQMYAKYDANHFGTCPRVYCSSGKLVPCGRSDLPGVDTVKLYCPSCVDMYVPPSSRFLGVDGALAPCLAVLQIHRADTRTRQVPSSARRDRKSVV